ncbi:MAG: D-alanyl-D-alanine carboxypeptidase family protein [Finegoldia sp.]|nr:D-alanyl-D-alanine carboxypeptidase family protein [Finegoldia sp.]
MKSLRRYLLTVVMTLVLILPSLSRADQSNLGIEEKVNGYYAMEVNSGQELLNYQEDQAFPIASLTKIMTYILVMEDVEGGKYSLNDEVKIEETYNEANASVIGLEKGDVLTVNDLIKGMLVASGNDAAEALAINSAGTSNDFVKAMNDKAKELGFESAEFFTPSGYPEGDNENVMSAKDVANMCAYAIRTYPQITNYTSQEVFSLPEKNFSKESTIPFLGEIDGVDGLKTGTSDGAGYCVSTSMTLSKGENGEKIVSVLLGAPDKYDRNMFQKEILDYIDTSFIPQKISTGGEVVGEISVNSAKDRHVKAVATEDISILYNEKTGLEQSVQMKEGLKAPIKEGDVVGEMVINTGKGEPRKVGLVSDKDYKRVNPLTRFSRAMEYIFTLFSKLLNV